MKKFKKIASVLILYVVGFVLAITGYIIYANHYINPRLNKDIDKMLFARFEFLDPDSNLVNFNKEFSGDIRLVDFWTLNCSFCSDDLENFYELDLTENKDFYILAVNKDDFDAWQEYLDEHNIRYKNSQIRHFHISDKKILEELEVEYYPSYFLVDPSGKIHSRCSYNFVLSKIKRVLSQKRFFSDYLTDIYKYFPCGGLGRPTIAYTLVIYPILLFIYFYFFRRMKNRKVSLS